MEEQQKGRSSKKTKKKKKGAVDCLLPYSARVSLLGWPEQQPACQSACWDCRCTPSPLALWTAFKFETVKDTLPLTDKWGKSSL